MSEKTTKNLRMALLITEWILALFSIFVCARKGFGGMPESWVFNIAADIVCMFINIFFIMGIMFGRSTASNKYNLFLALCISNFMALFFDLQSWMIDGNAAARGLVVFINTGLYCTNLFLTVFFCHFIMEIVAGDRKSGRICCRIADVIFVITVITRILNLKYGYLFTIDENGVYHRGTYQFTAYIYTIIVEIMVLIVVFRNRTSRRQKMAVLAFTLLPFAAAIASIFSYGLSITYACVLISIVMIYSAFFLELESDSNRLREIFGRFVSNDVVQAIVDNPDGNLIPGRRYNATILVSDIRGFTALSETLDPQSLITMLNHYFGVVAEIVSEYGGVVTEFLGDGILCVFGAPIVNADHAERAIGAALKIQEKIPEINEWNRKHGFLPIETGIGINTGGIVLGSVGSQNRARYTAVGQTVDRTFEIESCSLGGQVLASNSTLKAVRANVDSEFLLDYSWDTDQLVKIRINAIYQMEGPWHAGNEKEEPEYHDLTQPVPVSYCVIIGKHTDAAGSEGRITRVSPDTFVMECKSNPEVLDNIRVDIEGFGSVFAKIKSVRLNQDGEKSVLAGFTSRPEWLKKITGGR